ncbi:MAG: Lrp/AsnC family transcriptional regulator [Deltaproteobacteria bacterium]|nr:Lrp/AsnC family transcriptional regulator [Deltaproteobacteria bacterium]
MLDQTDIKILSILQQQGRRHLADIAKEVDLSTPAVMERVKKLESRGIIKAFRAILDANKLGKNITAFIGVSVSHQPYIDNIGGLMAAAKDVLECHHVTGEESFFLKVKTADTGSLEKLIAEIRSLEGVTRTVTNVVLSTSKESQILSLERALEKSSLNTQTQHDQENRKFSGTLGKK